MGSREAAGFGGGSNKVKFRGVTHTSCDIVNLGGVAL